SEKRPSCQKQRLRHPEGACAAEALRSPAQSPETSGSGPSHCATIASLYRLFVCEDAIAIVFRLVDPSGFMKRLMDHCCHHRLHAKRDSIMAIVRHCRSPHCIEALTADSESASGSPSWSQPADLITAELRRRC